MFFTQEDQPAQTLLLYRAYKSFRIGIALRKPHSLGVSEAFGFAAELLEKDAILGLKVIDYRQLMSVHPTNDGDQDELKLGSHR